MKIAHIAVWTEDIEKMKNFYMSYFNCTSNTKYTNPAKKFESYFLDFGGGCRLELMRADGILTLPDPGTAQYRGFAHIALSVGTEKDVECLTETLEKDGYEVVSPPRKTGDGYYESCVLDPEGNRLELTADAQ